MHICSVQRPDSRRYFMILKTETGKKQNKNYNGFRESPGHETSALQPHQCPSNPTGTATSHSPGSVLHPGNKTPHALQKNEYTCFNRSRKTE